jgi:spore coat polysaccharide biosynthesis protein SpsF
LAQGLDVGYFRGSEEDVLSRVLHAAEKYKADIIVEITGDCPLADHRVVSSAIELYLNNKCDYASNIEPVTFPIGMDAQVFSADTLSLADKEGKSGEDREHVSWFIRRQPERFKHLNLTAPAELHWPDLGLTLDEYGDYLLLKNIVEHFHPDIYFSCEQILEYLRTNPKLLEVNKDVKRKEPVK